MSDDAGSDEPEVAPEPGEAPVDRISARVHQAFEKVPAIGTRWNRWYDAPYRLLWLLQTGWRRRVVPKRVRSVFNRWANELLQVNEVDRMRSWDTSDPLHDFEVPASEHICMPAIWVVELFPPSQIDQLEAAISRNGWTTAHRASEASGEELLAQSRSRSRWRWWRIAYIQDVESRYRIPDGVRSKLPHEFDFIELKAVQIGSGLTAVVAHFRLSESGSQALDTVWHQPHQPELLRRNGRLRALDRMFAGFRRTQMARASLHEKARGWMRTNCPGFFANDGSSHTLIDLMLTSDFDPVANRHIPREWSDALRAIGLTESGFQRYSSAEAPGLLLEPVHLSLTPAIGTDRSWAFWGSSSVAAAGAGPLDMYGSPQPWAIASHYSEGVESFLVTLSVSDLLGSLEERYSKIRDNAQAQHGRFRPRYLDQFRRQWLTLSLDVASTKRDLERDWASRPTFENEMEFTLDFDLPAVEGQESRTYEPVHVNDSMRRHQREMLDALVASDSEYRDILSTVASLGASAEASRTGRRALWVALVSLLVALATVLVSDVGDHSLLNAVRQFLSSLFNHS